MELYHLTRTQIIQRCSIFNTASREIDEMLTENRAMLERFDREERVEGSLALGARSLRRTCLEMWMERRRRLKDGLQEEIAELQKSWNADCEPGERL